MLSCVPAGEPEAADLYASAAFWGKFMAISVEDAPSVQRIPARQVTLGWFLKRTIIGIAILMVAMGGLAWLTYASIDPDLDGETGSRSVGTTHEMPAKVTAVDL
jgi:hypothetical protein